MVPDSGLSQLWHPISLSLAAGPFEKNCLACNRARNS